MQLFVIGKHWLLIWDNVESQSLVREYFPTFPGSMLITSRRKEQAYHFKPRGPVFHVKQFSHEEALQLFQRLLGSVYREDSAEDVAAAHVLLDRIDGLAIAICTMATRITSQGFSIKNYLKRYKRGWQKVIAGEGKSELVDYDTSLEAVWNDSFLALQEQSKNDAINLLGVIMFLSPDEIPQELFVRSRSQPLQDSLGFCENQERYANICSITISN